MQQTRRSIQSSITALLLCFVMLVGTTFAWFTDTATSEGNVIKTGTLDIGMSYSVDNVNWTEISDTQSTPIFNYDNWEPGYTEVRYIKVQNLGSLSFQYQMAITPTGVVGPLADVIDVSYDIVTGNSTFVAPTADNKQGSLRPLSTLSDLIDANGIVAGGVLLPVGETADNYYTGEIVICVSFHMQETAGNDYQNQSIGDGFGIKLYATQFDYENDSFDSSYDDEAEWPTLENGYSASAPIDSANLILGALTSEVQIGGNGIGATIPADVKVADGATSLHLTMKKVDNGNLGAEDDNNATSFDVHIEGIADDNAQPMIVNLGAVLAKGLTDTELKLYHTENGTRVLMTRVDSVADFAIHNQYTYDPTTGEVSIYVASFSVFTAVEINADDWDGTSDTSWYDASKTEFTLTTAEQFAGFRDLVDGGNTFAGKYVKLGRDINLAGFNFDPIGRGYESSGGQVFKGTFDGQNYTIYNLKQNGWELGFDNGTQGAGLFASVVDATIKNLTISGADIKFDCVDMGIVVGYAYGTCNFENIIVTKSTIANYNRYTGGVVGEVNGTHTFKDIIVDSTVTISSLWGSFDTAIGGVIGGKYGNATVSMTNVIVAAELDVYSDVTAAYQWYAYRRCGMLIGHTEQNSPKSALNADAPFLTCENVNVFYGDWVNYNYYQFANQDNDTGKRYPWVRAEASPVGNNGAFSNPRYGVPTHGGTKVTELDSVALDAVKTGYAAITFNQLYGGGQGVYGKADHDGVTTYNLAFGATTTIYFQNSKGWENLKLQYKYKNGDDEYTTIVEGISLGDPVDTVPLHKIYKVVIPADAYSFTIIGDSEGETKTTGEILVNGLAAGDLYTLDRNNKVQHVKYDGKYNTIYFYNNKDWTNVSLYYWYKDSAGNNWDTLEFPGEKLESNLKDGSHDIYQFVVPSYATAFIISNGTKSHQTEDISITGCAGKIYDVSDETITNSNNVTANKVGSSTYKSGYTTIYLKNHYRWDNVQAYYNIGASWVQVGNVKLLGYDGSEEYYSVEIPNFATKFNFSGEKNDGSGARQQIKDQKLSDYTSYNMVTTSSGDGSNVTVTKGTFNTSTNLTGYRKLYFKPNSAWYSDNARMAIYLFGSGEKWYSLADKYSDGSYKIWVETKYTKVILCRMNGSNSTNNWNNKYNQSADLTIPTDGKNYFTSNSGWDGVNGTWSKK